MDELLASSDLCEEHGLARAAGLLRAASGGRAYVVLERGYEYNDSNYDLDARARPRRIHTGRAEAERAAAVENGRRLRDVNLSRIEDLFYGQGWLDDLMRLARHPIEEVSRRISAILGRPFDLFAVVESRWPGGLDEAWFPADATDEQMAEIAGLFHLPFFTVVEVDFALEPPAAIPSEERS